MPLKMPIPVCSILFLTVSGSHSMSTPTASRMSTAPQVEVRALAPCLAMQMPPAAATIAAAVLMLKVLKESIPVPQFSTRGWATRGVAFTVSIS